MDVSIIRATFQTADNDKLNDIIRLLLGLKGLIDPKEVAFNYEVVSLANTWVPPSQEPDEEPF